MSKIVDLKVKSFIFKWQQNPPSIPSPFPILLCLVHTLGDCRQHTDQHWFGEQGEALVQLHSLGITIAQFKNPKFSRQFLTDNFYFKQFWLMTWLILNNIKYFESTVLKYHHRCYVTRYLYVFHVHPIMCLILNLKYVIIFCLFVISQLQIDGYNSKQLILLRKIMEKMTTFTVDENRFGVIKETVSQKPLL